jgi:hypothetical protein
MLEAALRNGGTPGFAVTVPDARTPAQRAILVAAQLVGVAAAPQ